MERLIRGILFEERDGKKKQFKFVVPNRKVEVGIRVLDFDAGDDSYWNNWNVAVFDTVCDDTRPRTRDDGRLLLVKYVTDEAILSRICHILGTKRKEDKSMNAIRKIQKIVEEFE